MRKIKTIKSKNALAQTRKYYISYGLTTNLDSMLSICPGAQLLGNIRITGYRLCFKTHCDLLEDKNSSVECVLWSITQDCEQRLDLLEGYPEYYTKKNLNVKYKDKVIKAMVYLMQEKTSENMPSQNYFELVVQGYRQNKLDITQLEQALISAHQQESIATY